MNMKLKILSGTFAIGVAFAGHGVIAAEAASSYKVGEGDSLWKIAQKTHTTTSELKQWNHLSSDLIHTGQVLKVSNDIKYKVQPGDSLWKIANEHGVSVQDLITWNKLSSNLLQVGQTLTIKDANTKGNLKAAVPSTQKAIDYTVQPNDSLWTIANKYGVSVDDLMAWNGLSNDSIDHLQIGQVLRVYGVSESNHTKETQVYSANVNQSDTTVKSEPKQEVKVEPKQEIKQDAQSFQSKQEVKAESKQGAQSSQPKQEVKVEPKQEAQSSQPKKEPVKQEVKKETVSKSQATGSVANIIAEGKKYIGTPYVWGGTSPSGFDCSGFIQYVFAQNGISIPRTVSSIWSAGTSVGSPSVGDIVFFETYKSGPSHAGIYLGGGKFLHAGTSSGVTISDMNSSYWSPKYLGAKRLR